MDEEQALQPLGRGPSKETVKVLPMRDEENQANDVSWVSSELSFERKERRVLNIHISNIKTEFSTAFRNMKIIGGRDDSMLALDRNDPVS